MKTVLIFALALAVAGCSKTTEDDTARNACSEAVRKGVDSTVLKRKQSLADSRKAGGLGPSVESEKLMDDVGAKLKDTLTTLCVEDHWSAEVVNCFNTSLDIAKCKDGLTPEQRGRYSNESMKAMMPARTGQGSGGMGRINPHTKMLGSGSAQVPTNP